MLVSTKIEGEDMVDIRGGAAEEKKVALVEIGRQGGGRTLVGTKSSWVMNL